MASAALSHSPVQRRRRRNVIPGFGIAFGYTLTYLGLVVLIPLGVLIVKSSAIGISGFAAVLGDPRIRHA